MTTEQWLDSMLDAVETELTGVYVYATPSMREIPELMLKLKRHIKLPTRMIQHTLIVEQSIRVEFTSHTGLIRTLQGTGHSAFLAVKLLAPMTRQFSDMLTMAKSRIYPNEIIFVHD